VRPYLEKTPHKKRTGGVVEGESPEFKPQYQKKKKKLNLFPIGSGCPVPHALAQTRWPGSCLGNGNLNSRVDHVSPGLWLTEKLTLWLGSAPARGMTLSGSPLLP
jgi:hypothetical protein